MSKVPVVHVTEMLAQAFGIVAATVERQLVGHPGAHSSFNVVDRVGVAWRLDVSIASPRNAEACATNSADGSARSAFRWDRRWTVSPLQAAADFDERGGEAAQVRRLEPSNAEAQAVPSPETQQAAVGWDCADGRALERVGSWLVQPAGLPTATDILGQCFVDMWSQNREHIAAMHGQAERLHDALDRHAAGREGSDAALRTESIRNESYRHQRVLRHLVDSQQLLLGPQAAAYPVAHRREVLRRLAALLEAERAHYARPTVWGRAG